MDLTPEEIAKRYEEYQDSYVRRVAEAFFNDHHHEEWFVERYSPKQVLTRQQALRDWAAQEHLRFKEELQGNPAAFIESVLLEPIGKGKAKKPKTSDDKDDESLDFEVDEDRKEKPTLPTGKGASVTPGGLDGKALAGHLNCTVFIRRVPTYCKRAILEKAVEETSGKFERLLMSDAGKNRSKEYERSAYIIYATEDAAKKAVKELHNKKVLVEDTNPPPPPVAGAAPITTPKGKTFTVQAYIYAPKTPTTAAKVFAHPLRVQKDTQLVLELAAALDHEKGLDESGLSTLLDKLEVIEHIEAKPTALLDVTIAYLRRVHFFNYYTGQQCLDEGDLISTHSGPIFRDEPYRDPTEEELQEKAKLGDDNDTTADDFAETGKKSSSRRPEWFQPQPLDALVKQRMLDASDEEMQRAEEDLNRMMENIEQQEDEARDVWIAKNSLPEDEGRARCGIEFCRKLFKSTEFLQKHLGTKHADIFASTTAKIIDPHMKEIFLQDPRKPIPPITVAETNVNVTVEDVSQLKKLYPSKMPEKNDQLQTMTAVQSVAQQAAAVMAGAAPLVVDPALLPINHPLTAMSGMGSLMGLGMGAMGGGRFPLPPFGRRGRFSGERFRGRFQGRGRGMYSSRHIMEVHGPPDPRQLASYMDIDAPQTETPALDFGNSFPPPRGRRRESRRYDEGEEEEGVSSPSRKDSKRRGSSKSEERKDSDSIETVKDEPSNQKTHEHTDVEDGAEEEVIKETEPEEPTAEKCANKEEEKMAVEDSISDKTLAAAVESQPSSETAEEKEESKGDTNDKDLPLTENEMKEVEDMLATTKDEDSKPQEDEPPTDEEEDDNLFGEPGQDA